MPPRANRKNTFTRAAAYLRRSRDDGHGETTEEVLERQRRAVNMAAAEEGLVIKQYYTEVVSGASIADRPKMQELLEDLRAGKWDVVLVVEISRLSRGDGSDQAVISNAFRLTDTKVLCDLRLYDLSRRDDLDLFESKLQSSRMEYKSITARLQRGVRASIAEGYSGGGTVPYGLALSGPSRRRVYVPGEDFENLKLIFSYPHVATNPTWSGLSELLHDLGIPSPFGFERWSRTTLKGLFCNPAYCGRAVWGATVTESSLGEHFEEVRARVRSENPIDVEAKWERFFDEEWLREGYELMRKRRPPRGGSLGNPLVGLIVCSKCGANMEYASDGGSGKAYYKHSARSTRKIGCNCKSTPREPLMRALLTALEQDASAEAVQSRINGAETRKAAVEISLRKIEEELARTEKSQMRAYDRLERGIIGEKMFEQIEKRLEGTLERLRNNAKLARAELAAYERPPAAVEKEKSVRIKDAIAALKDERLAASDVNAALRQVVRRVEYANKAKMGSHDQDIELTVVLL